MYLFIDTTKDITLGLLDNDFKWLAYQFYTDSKSSAIIHKLIDDLMIKFQTSIDNIEGVIQVAGPGSYTGMRVSEGILQVFSWQKIKTYSFYHFDVPAYLNEESGLWLGNAFKGEVFVYSWWGSKHHFELIKNSDLDGLMLKNTHLPKYRSFDLENSNVECLLTSKMIYEQPQKIFSKVVSDKILKPIYYYRTIEQEYKRSDI